MKILCFGDSITQGLGDEEKSSFPAILGAQNLGISGNHTQSLLNRLGELREWPEAQYVVLLIGTNDASLTVTEGKQISFEQNYKSIVDQITAMGKKLILMNIPREIYRTELNPVIINYNKHIITYPLPIIGLWDINEKYFVDGEHFNHAGNIYVADLIAKRVMELDNPQLYVTDPQERGLIKGYDLKKLMDGKMVGTQDDLDFLLKNQQVIPESWKGSWIIFWGTVKDESVKMMHFQIDKWVEGIDLLSYDFDNRSPAIIYGS